METRSWSPKHDQIVPYQIFTAIVVNAYIVLRSRYPCWLESRAQRRRAWFVFAWKITIKSGRYVNEQRLQRFSDRTKSSPAHWNLKQSFTLLALLSGCTQHGRKASEVHELDSGMYQLASKSEIEARLGANLPDNEEVSRNRSTRYRGRFSRAHRQRNRD